jgi:hypothetical protein
MNTQETEKVQSDLQKEFLTYVINSSIKTADDWINFGKRFGQYLITTVDEEKIKTDEDLKTTVENLMSPPIIAFTIQSWVNTSKELSFEMGLFQIKKLDDESIADDFTQGILEALAEKWPRLLDL